MKHSITFDFILVYLPRIKTGYMENEKNQLILIQIKLLEKEPLLPAEMELWKRWEERSASLTEPGMDIADIVLLMDIYEDHVPADELLKRLDEDAKKYELVNDSLVLKEENPSNHAPPVRKISFIRKHKQRLSIAAGILLATLLLIAYLLLNAPGSRSAPELMLTASTAAGQTKDIILSDNASKIKLNAISNISYPESLNGQSRLIKLSGEAYFNIAKQTGKQHLIVRAGFMDIEVVGTRFNVSAYDNDPVIKVTLDEGEIWITNGKERKMLKAPFIAIVSRDSIPVSRQKMPGKEVPWIDGIYSYSKLSLPQIMEEVKRTRNISAVYKDFSKDWLNILYNVPYSRNEPLTVLLDRLERVDYFEYQPKGKEFKEGDTVTFIRKP